jgi:hypothetical protein
MSSSGSRARRRRRRSSVPARALGLLLILLMAIGSVLLWIGIPVGVLWVASRIATSAQPSMALYAGVAVAIPTFMFLCARALWWLDTVYARVTRAHRDSVYRPGWMRSMRGERHSDRSTTILDVVMIASVAVALVATGIWFFFFAGSSLPSGGP